MKIHTPVLLIAFNRVETCDRIFSAIQKAQPTRLYFAVDGPRNEDEVQVCQQVQNIVNKVDWPCRVQTLFRSENLGCSVAVTTAISWFFEQEEEGIILEDDCLPTASFFSFCQTLLERYRDDSRISVISGTNHLLNRFSFDSDYYFSNMTHIWGWASWRRTWQGYSLTDWQHHIFVQSKVLERNFSSFFATKMMKYCMGLPIDPNTPAPRVSWDYRFASYNLTQHRISIIPVISLITNIGGGTHQETAQKKFIYDNMPSHEMIDVDKLQAPETMLPFYQGDQFTVSTEHGFRGYGPFKYFKGIVFIVVYTTWRRVKIWRNAIAAIGADH